MAKENWEEIRGFPELKVCSGIDGYGVIMAVSSGLKFKFLREPKRIYHQYHEPFKGRPLHDKKKYIKETQKMLIEKKTNNL